ncbi:DNA-binding protein [Paraburkholderia phenazinium]|uniref:DNA-binding protein n=3 Tax=Paraburkholderia phenazinium TaxID=60549 RepID=UPI0015916BA6|nr:DNA-binding protein [Paraburkholderia phenazinium]
MAREANITQDQVSRAAESIRDAGGRPTARAIRERLGTGSMATVLKFFQAWQDAQVRPAEAPVVLPQALQRGLLDFVAAEVDRSRAELHAELDIANQANADLIVESERQSLIVENLTASLEAAHAEKAELAGRLAQVEAERDAAREEAFAERAAAESARTDLAKALLRLEAMLRLEKDLDEVRQELETERAARVGAEQAAAVAAAKLEASLDARQALERSLDESKHHAQEKDAELAGVRTELREAHTAADTLRAELLATVRPRTRRALPATQTRKKP